MNKKRMKEKGITLIALVITIIVMLILAGVAIGGMIESGIFGMANEANFKSRMSEYKEQSELYAGWQIIQTMETNISWINAGDVLKDIIKQEIIMDIKQEDVTINIQDVLEKISNQEKEYIVIYKGEMCYVSSSDIKNNENQKKWCQEIGIKILEYTPPTGIQVKNGKYELVKGIYLCTPKLNEGFVSEKTRYLEVNEQGNMTPGNWITDSPTENWYDYKNSMWANIIVEDSGSEVYYTWIPRYCFKLDQVNQRSDVKFIDTDNTYKDKDGNLTTWEELESQGYQVPEAFNFNQVELGGYWATKYTTGDITVPSTINYDMTVLQGKITIKNVTLNTNITNANPIAKYTIALNGKIVKIIQDAGEVANITSQIIEFSDLKKGDNVINITGLNSAGEIVGSMTKVYSPAIVNKPELSAFDQNTTFYVTYDENGKENSTTPINKAEPKYWYEYGEGRWANIVTRNNELETYYVWIPRYQFQLDQTNQRSSVKFLSGTSTQADEGYQIPEAFTFNGQELTGYWATKYTLGTESAPRFASELVATSSSIKAKGITGTAKAEGQKYKYYIDGEYKGESTNANDWFEFVGLKSNTVYTINIEVRNNASDEYVGSITKQISTIDANKPDLTGFNTDVTYYLVYDENGNEVIGEKVKTDGSNSPSNWYNYSNSMWANIVVKANGNETYFTWIPRYEFKITSSQQAQPAVGRADVRFINGNATDASKGYQIPEAFTFNGQELTGYWSTKYTVGT